MTNRAALTAFPMHGQHKLTGEGYRTRDGHFIEWFGRLLADAGVVSVVSRPEPLPLHLLHRRVHGRVATNTAPINTASLRFPNLRDRRRWWIDSVKDYKFPEPEANVPVIAWNPFVALSPRWSALTTGAAPIHFDLLDDWTIHFAFQGIGREVHQAYEAMFASAHTVSANAEGTVALAKKFGRDDVEFLPNGVDPTRFTGDTRATGPLTVGYVGKIGRRVDLELIIEVATALPDMRFIFAGPILDQEYRAPLQALTNVELLGDVHYEQVPALLETFDVGWVPHRVGVGEVGGDVIKTYEYRAAGLQVLATPFAGVAERGFDALVVAPGVEHASLLQDVRDTMLTRIARIPEAIPERMTWKFKAEVLLERLGFSDLKVDRNF